MKKLAVLLTLTAVFGLVFVAGSMYGSRRSGSGQGTVQTRSILRYMCPMHPAYTSDRPGDCPSCGMRLEPVYADGGSVRADAPSDAARLVKVTTERQQIIGVRTGLVGETGGRQMIRTVGRVAADETRAYRLIAATDGWIQELGSAATGSLVTKGQKLGAYYSPEFPQAQQAFLMALTSPGQFQPARGPQPRSPEQLTADSLRAMGVSEDQLAEMAKTRQIFPNIWIVSPAAGFVTARDVTPGRRFDRGTEFYAIADLSRVWIIADIFGRQAEFVKPGTLAHITVPEREREYQALVSNAQPLFDETTRTLKVRLETDNPGSVLKPGMFVDVDFEAVLPMALTVPTEAVVDSGLRKTVFVDRGNGYFEPRRVETGWRVGDRVQILRGVMAGERIVVAGTFLMDSESRMKAAAAGPAALEPVTDVVCGMSVDPKKAAAAGRTVLRDGETYYFCSEECKRKFEARPSTYTAPAPALPVRSGSAVGGNP